MTTYHASSLTSRNIAAALSIGTIAVLMVGLQPILLGELVESHTVTLEGIGIVAMGEIIALGLGVLISEMLLPLRQLKLITIVAAILAMLADLATTFATGDTKVALVRTIAGFAEGILVWGTTSIIVQTENPDRVGGIFFVIQTIAQAGLGALLAIAVIPQSGWQGGFTVLAVLSLFPCAIVFLLPVYLAPLEEKSTSGFTWSVATVLPLIIVFFQLAATGAFWAYAEPLGKNVGFDAQAAQTMLSGVLVMQVIGGLVATFAVRHFNAIPVLVFGTIVLGSSVLMTHGMRIGNTVSFAVACAVFGFSWLLLLPFQIKLAFRADSTGRVATLVPAFQLLGSAFGPMIVSLAIQGDDASAVPLISTSFGAIALVLLLVESLRFKRTRR